MSFGTLIHRHPMRTAAATLLDAERALEEIQRQFASHPSPRLVGPRHFVPRIDAVEEERQYVISAELPGVDAADIEVSIEDGVLSIRGERKSRVEAEGQAEERDAKALGAFERRVRFNGEVVEGEIKAHYKDGLLTVTVPKPEEPVPQVRTIPVQSS